MARRYVQVYYDFICSLTPLSDAERGRLFTAMLDYAGQGTEPELRGNERFVWPQLKTQIDRDNEKYDEISRIRSDAGKQGGLAKSGKHKQKKQLPASASKSNHDKYKDDDNDNDEEESKKMIYFNSAWRTSERARGAVAQNLIDGWDTVKSNAGSNAGIDLNRILCEFMAAGMAPNVIADVLQNCERLGFVENHLFTEAVHLGILDDDSVLRPAGYDL